MTKKIMLLAILFTLLLSGCLDETKNKVILIGDGNATGDNKVKVSTNDTNADFLFSKLTAGSNISLAILNPGANESVSISAVGSATGNTDLNISSALDFQASLDGVSVWANQPAGVTEFAGNINRILFDANGFTQFRITSQVTGIDPTLTGTPLLYVQFSDDNVTFTDLNITPNGSIPVSSTGTMNSPWVAKNTSAIGDKYYRIVGVGGDGIGGPSLRQFHVQFQGTKTLSSTIIDVNATGIDSNKVKVSSSDTTADFLFEKLQAGSGITLAIQNSGGDENVLISSTGGSGTSRTYTSGTPATIEVNNDLNTISQNFDGNFWSRFTPANDGNFYTRFQPNFDSNFWLRFTPANDGNFYVRFQTNFDSNFWVRFTPAYDGNFWLRFTPAYDSNFWSRFGPAFDSNFWSRFSPAYDGNFWSRFTPAYDGNFWSRFTPANDGNFYTRFKTNFDSNFYAKNAGDINWVTFNTYFNPSGAGVPDANILNSVRYKQDSSCDNNLLCTTTNKITTTVDANFNNIKFNGTLSGGDFNYSLGDANGSQTASAGSALSSVGATVTSIIVPPVVGSCDNNVNCTITGRINTTQDANFRNIRFTGTLSGGDFNYSLGDANGTQSCPAGQALQVIGSTVTCVGIPSGSGRTYTSGTPATIEVNNDLNTISQNFDGNFWSRFTPANDGNFYTKFIPVFDSNFWSRFTPAYDSNFWLRFTPAFDSNFWSRFTPAYDSNFWLRFTPANDGNFYTRFSQNFDSNLWNRITALVPWADVNVSDDLRINTTKDANFNNIRFLGVLSGGDFNYSLSDANNSQSCPAGQALQSVGNTTTCVSTGGGDLNWTALNQVIPWADINVSDTITAINYVTTLVFNASYPWQDANISDDLRINTLKDANFNNIRFLGTLSGGDFNYSLSDANASQSCGGNLALSSVGPITNCISVPSEANIDGNFNTSLALAVPWADANVSDDLRINTLKDANIGDLNVTSDINAHGNVRIDNNLLVSKDLNVSRYAGFDNNVTLNTAGSVLRWRDNTGFICIGGNKIDTNGGIIFFAC